MLMASLRACTAIRIFYHIMFNSFCAHICLFIFVFVFAHTYACLYLDGVLGRTNPSRQAWLGQKQNGAALRSNIKQLKTKQLVLRAGYLWFRRVLLETIALQREFLQRVQPLLNQFAVAAPAFQNIAHVGVPMALDTLVDNLKQPNVPNTSIGTLVEARGVSAGFGRHGSNNGLSQWPGSNNGLRARSAFGPSRNVFVACVFDIGTHMFLSDLVPKIKIKN